MSMPTNYKGEPINKATVTDFAGNPVDLFEPIYTENYLGERVKITRDKDGHKVVTVIKENKENE